MNGLEHATPVVVLLLVGFFWLVLWSIARAKRQAGSIYVRRIPGVDAIDQAVGRAVEQGRPLSFSTGLTVVGPVLYAILGILYHVAKRAATYRAKLLLPMNDPQVMVIAEDTTREGYRAVGRVNEFDPNNIRFLSEEQFAFASGYMGMVHRENVGTALLFGAFAGESLILAEAGQQVGAMQVAGSVSPEQVPFFITACDYTLIGEELFAASAYLTREPVQLGSLYAQDRAKIVVIGIILLGISFATARSLYPDLPILGLEEYIMFSWDKLFFNR